MSDRQEYQGLGCIWPFIILAAVVPICIAAVEVVHIVKGCR